MAPLSCGEVYGGVQETLPRLSGGAAGLGCGRRGQRALRTDLVGKLVGRIDLFASSFLSAPCTLGCNQQVARCRTWRDVTLPWVAWVEKQDLRAEHLGRSVHPPHIHKSPSILPLTP